MRTNDQNPPAISLQITMRSPTGYSWKEYAHNDPVSGAPQYARIALMYDNEPTRREYLVEYTSHPELKPRFSLAAGGTALSEAECRANLIAAEYAAHAERTRDLSRFAPLDRDGRPIAVGQELRDSHGDLVEVVSLTPDGVEVRIPGEPSEVVMASALHRY
jgi:hypothetical protein